MLLLCMHHDSSTLDAKLHQRRRMLLLQQLHMRDRLRWRGQPLGAHLIMTCKAVFLLGLLSLKWLKAYMFPLLFAQDLEGIAHCCPRLTSLNISSCRSLHPAALSILFPNLDQQQQQQRVHGGQGASSSCALPLLTSLDVSYSPLPAGMVCRLLQYGYRFQVTAAPTQVVRQSMICQLAARLLHVVQACGFDSLAPQCFHQQKLTDIKSLGLFAQDQCKTEALKQW